MRASKSNILLMAVKAQLQKCSRIRKFKRSWKTRKNVLLNLRIPGQLFASHGTTTYYASLIDETQQTHSMNRLLAVIQAFSLFETSYVRGLNKLYLLNILLCYLVLVMEIAYFARNSARILIHIWPFNCQDLIVNSPPQLLHNSS